MKKLVLCLVLLVAGCGAPRAIVYKGGDIVQLKSGGPKMTVVRDVYDDNSVPVVWMDNLGQPHFNSYYQSQLTRAE